MKKIQDSVALFFIVAVSILTIVCVLGVWNFFGHDVIWKSFETIGLLALVAVVVIVGGHYIGNGEAAVPVVPNQMFSILRRMTIFALIGLSGLLAFVGVLSIWNVIQNGDILNKTVGSLAVLCFGVFLIVATCMDRENNPLLKKGGVSVGGVVLGVILLYLIFAFSGLFS